jgi:protein BCP1
MQRGKGSAVGPAPRSKKRPAPAGAARVEESSKRAALSAATAANAAAAAAAADSGTSSDDSESEEEDGSEEDGGSDASDINVTFDFHDPAPIDFKSIRRLLESFLPGAEDTFGVSDIADAILGQAEVGTTVKVEDDNDVYAFATVMPLAKYADSAWFATLRKFLVAKANPEPVRARLGKLLGKAAASASASAAAPEASEEGGEGAAAAPVSLPVGPDPGIGLLLNERVVNMPPELAPSILDALCTDIEWARTSGPEEDRHWYATLSYLLVQAPCWGERTAATGKVRAAAAAAGEGEAGDAPLPLPLPSAASSTVHYYHFEDALFEAEALATFEYPVAVRFDTVVAASSAPPPRAKAGGESEGATEQSGSTLRAPQLRRVFLVPFSALRRVADAAKAQVAAAAAAEEVTRAAAEAKLLGGEGAAAPAAAGRGGRGGPARGRGGRR